ncbi:MAG TPA: DNA repair protein RecO [Bacilli bacterium]|nr:DNA repair protein RecO [Bacilli bacterium]
MIEAIEGIVISEVPYGETSKIINVFSKEHGIVGVMCKGAKSMKSRLRAVTTKFTFGIFNVYYKKDKLSTLISVDITDNLSNIKQDILLMGYINYLTELATQVYKQNEDKEIYSLYIKTILKMENQLDPAIMTNILELKLLDFLGVNLELNKCVKCGNKDNIVTIDPEQGGYICSKCRTTEEILDCKVIKMMRMYYYVEIDSISKIAVNYDVSHKIDLLLNNYYDRYTGLYLYSKKFLDNIKK